MHLAHMSECYGPRCQRVQCRSYATSVDPTILAHGMLQQPAGWPRNDIGALLRCFHQASTWSSIVENYNIPAAPMVTSRCEPSYGLGGICSVLQIVFKWELGRYRQLGPRAAIHVSPLVLGGMSIGTQWAQRGFGAMDKESSFKLLDAYFDAGGNFIDTANAYQDGTSEQLIGEWAEARGVRDQLIIATKYTSNYMARNPPVEQLVNYLGNNLKSLKLSLEASLKKLRTTYVDILYLHYWDLHTSMEEVMDGLHNMVVQGKVLYLGISDAPAWLVVKANEYARANGKTPFVVYQAPYSVLQRDIEREILPMCRHEGIALTLWNVLAAGHIRSDEEEERRRQTGEKGRTIMRPWERTPDEKKMCDALEVVAQQVGAKNITAVAIAYTMHKAPFIFPIIGGRKVEHLQANIEALGIRLSDEQIKYLESILPFDKGFPNNFAGSYGDNYPIVLRMHATFDEQPLLPPIVPSVD